MKKQFITGLMVLIASIASAQTQFGITAGCVNAGSKVNSGNSFESSTTNGYSFGLVADIPTSYNFHTQIEAKYLLIDKVSFIQIPVVEKIFVSDHLNLQVGPQLTINSDDVADDFTKLNLALAVGFGADFRNGFFLNARYGFQLNDYYTGSSDLSSKISFINVNFGLKFI